MKRISYILSSIVIIFNLFVLCAYSKVELPEIPQRPRIEDLKKSLSNVVEPEVMNENQGAQSVEQGNPSVKIRNFSNGHIKLFFKSNFNKKTKESCDYLIEKPFKLNSDYLFASSLNAVMSLKGSLKSFDTNLGKIVTVDNSRNTIIIQIIGNGNNDSTVKIVGYASKFGKSVLGNNIQKLLGKIR